MRHPSDKWGTQTVLSRLIFFTVREALYKHRHPDYKRQRTTKQRNLKLWGARKFKREATTL